MSENEQEEIKLPEGETEKKEDDVPKFRGLYRNVKISVKTLDKIIVAGILAIFVVIFIGYQHNGYTITFDSNGGTDVESQDHMYGELVEKPEDPTREGYTFDGWYFDENYAEAYDFENETVYNSLTLYAKWNENTETE